MFSAFVIGYELAVRTAMARALSSESATPAGTTTADELFKVIDGRTVSWGHLRCTVEVYGITEMASARWIQLRLRGDTDRMVTLRLPPGSDESTTMHALSVALAEQAGEAFDVQPRD